MAGGRPTDYRQEHCETAVELGKAGKSKAQMCAHFDISRQTIDNWAAAHPDFLEALTRAMAHCQAWWEDQAQINLAIPGFNAAVWKKSVEARFRDDYTERQEVAHSGSIKHTVTDMTDDELAAIIAGKPV